MAAAARPTPSSHAKRGRAPEQEGFALLLSLIALTILAVLITDLHEVTSSGFSAAIAQRDQLRAEFLAKSGLNLTRMLIGQEKNLRPLVAGPYALLTKGKKPPQLPVWQYANMILSPFANYESSSGDLSEGGFDVSGVEGLGDTGGTFEISAVSENSKLNVSMPLSGDMNTGRNAVAVQLYSLMGGNQPSPNRYDPLFSKFDDKGHITTRLDVVASVIDWWDPDDQATQYDPALFQTVSAGSEDTGYYSSLSEPYGIKNAPFDTVEELRLVRGISDDFWATFVEPDPDDVQKRLVTVYGGGSVNPNEAEPTVMLARLCSFQALATQPLCNDMSQIMTFMTLISFARAFPIPWFSRARDFLDFVSGQPGSLFETMQTFMGGSAQGGAGGGAAGGAGLFTPLVIPQDQIKLISRAFTTRARIMTIGVIGKVGNAEKRVRAVINTSDRWVPPPPNSGTLPPLGVFHYFRID